MAQGHGLSIEFNRAGLVVFKDFFDYQFVSEFDALRIEVLKEFFGAVFDARNYAGFVYLNISQGYLFTAMNHATLIRNGIAVGVKFGVVEKCLQSVDQFIRINVLELLC